MFNKTVVLLSACGFAFSGLANAQTSLQPCQTWGAYPKTQDPDPYRVDKFFGDWHDSNPKPTHGGLVERDILTKGDAMEPPRKGAVLEDLNSYTYATLAPGASTTPMKLQGQQEIFYFLSGKGEVMSGGQTAEVYANVGVLMPPGVEFSMKNKGAEPLSMYVINEILPASFTPKTKMVVRDENATGISETDFTKNGHWAHIVKVVFEKTDGLAAIGRLLTVALDPMTIGEPHGHRPGQKEVWTAINGTSIAFVGTQVRNMPPGMAYQIRPDTVMTHSNINAGKEQVKFLWFATNVRPPQ